MTGHPEIPNSRLTRVVIGDQDVTDVVRSIELVEHDPDLDAPIVKWRAEQERP